MAPAKQEQVKTKEIAKFLSGFAANQLLTHGAMAAIGAQFAIFGVRYSSGLHAAAALFWALLLFLLVYYAWIRSAPK